MFTHSVTSYSEISAGEAVAMAIGMAADAYTADAKYVHFVITGVAPIGPHGWKAMVTVIIEPVLDEDYEEKLELKRAHEHEVEEHKRRHEKEEPEHEMTLEDVEDIQISPSAKFDALLFMHIPQKLEEFEDEIKEALENKVDIHPERIFKIEPGPVWDHFEDFVLETKFYEATHQLELERKRAQDQVTLKLTHDMKKVGPTVSAYLKNLTLTPMDKIRA